MPTSSSQRELALAIKLGDLELCKSLVKAGASLRQGFYCCDGCTPLLTALNCGHDHIARYFIKEGASISGQICDLWDTRGYSAVHLASRMESQSDLLQLLLAEDAKLGSLCFESPVHPTHIAVACENLAGLKILLEHIQGKNKPLGNSAVGSLSTAVAKMGGKKLNSLEHTSGARPGLPSGKQRRQQQTAPPLYDSQIGETTLQWTWLLRRGVSSQQPTFTTQNLRTGSLLHAAAFVNNYKATKLLLEFEADADQPDKNNQTPLHIAATRGYTSLSGLLLESGANPNTRDFAGRTPAILAAVGGHTATLECLQRHNADFSICGFFGDSVLHHAAAGGPGAFSLLLMLGCDPYCRDKYERTPLHMAYAVFHDYPALAALIYNSGLDLTFRSGMAGGILHYMLSKDGKISILRRCLKRIPKNVITRDIDTSTAFTSNPLYQAAVRGDKEVMGMLIRAGADLEVGSENQGSPLIAACAAGRLVSVKILVRAGAKTFYRKEGKVFSSVQFARYYPSVVRWLLAERYTEQFKIGFAAAAAERTANNSKICSWSGPITLEVPVLGRCSTQHGQSSIDLAIQLFKLRRDLAGKVVNHGQNL